LTVVSIDGATPIAADEPETRLSVLDRGLLHGDGAFEVLRTYGGAPFRLRDHLARLARSCAAARITLPVSLDALDGEVRDTLASAIAAGTPAAPAVAQASTDADELLSATDERHLRIVVTRGDGSGGLRIRGDEHARRIVVVAPLVLPSVDDYARGVSVALVSAGHVGDATGLGGMKTLGYLRQILALEAARDRGADDALLVTPSGDVLEGATSCVVVVRGGVLRSPPESTGILRSITWDTVGCIARDKGLRVAPRMLSPRDVYAADEVMLLSSLRGVMSVVAADGVAIGAGVPGPVATMLRTALHAHALVVARQEHAMAVARGERLG